MIRQLWFWLVLFGAAAAVVRAPAVEFAEPFGPRLLAPEIQRLPPVYEFPALRPLEGTEFPRQALPAPAGPQEEELSRPKAEEESAETTPPPDDAPAEPRKEKSADKKADKSIDPPKKPIKLWSGSFNLGLDGTEGNTETFNFRFGFHTKRKAKCNELNLGLDYNRQTTKTVSSADRLYFDGRFEKLFGASRWSASIHETIEYDQFQPFDVRDTTDAGLGYRLIDREETTLVGRAGGGFSHEYGGPENGEYVPEAVFSLQFEHQLNKRQKLTGSTEYAPDVTRFTRYRLRTQAAWEVLLDRQKNLNLRMSVLDRYNSVPNGARPNDLDYALMLMWKF